MKSHHLLFYGKIAFSLLWIFLTFPSQARAESLIRVRLFDTTPSLAIKTITTSGQYRIHNQTIKLPTRLLIDSSGNRLRLSTINHQRLGYDTRLILQAIGPQGICITRQLAKTRCYSGDIQITLNPDHTLSLINTLSKQHYLESVLSSETPANWPFEALKAQAVLSQTRLHNSLAKVPKATHILSDSTNEQAYLGIRHNHQVQAALKSVWGQFLAYDNRPIEVYYHSACGGHTSDDGYFQGSIIPRHAYSVGVKCPYCHPSPFQKMHVATLPLPAYQQVFGKTEIRMNAKDAGNRYRIAQQGSQSSSAYDVWLKLGQRFGWDKAPGTNFSIEQNAKTVTIRSQGAGHGVGLCQWGAAGLARQGKNYEQILHFYYPKAFIQNTMK